MDAPGNEIGAAGAAALVEGLKEMTNLTQLDLSSDGWYCLLSGCDELDEAGCWCAHGEGAGGQGE